MIPNDVVPGNATEPIWDMMKRCALSAQDERELSDHATERGLLFFSTPFSRAAADRLAELDVPAYKIGSGECNNYPLVRHVASLGKPVIVSTGMNDLDSIRPTVEILRTAGVGFALLHCTSLYPTPPELVRLGALREMADAFPDAVLGLSDHTTTIYPCLGAVALGASILERHFTVDMSWPGPDIPVSSTPAELAELTRGSRLVHAALGGSKAVLAAEQPPIHRPDRSRRDLHGGEPLGQAPRHGRDQGRRLRVAARPPGDPGPGGGRAGDLVGRGGWMTPGRSCSSPGPGPTSASSATSCWPSRTART